MSFSIYVNHNTQCRITQVPSNFLDWATAVAGEADRELTYSSLLICAHGYGYIKNNLRIFDKNTVLIGKIWKNMDLMGQHDTFFHSDLSTHNVLQGKNTVVTVTTTANF